MSEQQEQDFSEIIDTGLEAILSGKMTLEGVLQQHPDQAELIRPELETAMWLNSRQNVVAPRAGFVMASRRRVVERINQEASSRGTKRALFGFLWPTRFAYRTAAALVIVVMLLIASGGIVSASQAAIPGDGLYSVKRLTEQVTYQVTASPAQKVDLSVDFSGRRLEEAKALLARGDTARAKIALLEYKQNLDMAMVELEQIPTAQKNQVSESAEFVQDKLTEHAGLLQSLKQSAPVSASTALDMAILATNGGISSASAIYNDVNGILPTPTTTPTAEPSETPTDLPSIAPTEAASPTDDASSAEGTPAPGSTITSGQGGAKASPTPTVNPKSIRTPKPTNENRPPKPEVPPGKDKDPKPDPPKSDNPGKNK